MLKNEVAALQYNKQSAERPLSRVGAKLRAALVSAGHRAIQSVMFVGHLPNARPSQCSQDMRDDDKDEVGSGLERRLVRFSSSESDADEAHPTFERCRSEPTPRACLHEPTPRACLQARRGRGIAPYRNDPTSSDDDDLDVLVISVGSKLLPLSGTW